MKRVGQEHELPFEEETTIAMHLDDSEHVREYRKLVKLKIPKKRVSVPWFSE
jgi:hypothetical protein